VPVRYIPHPIRAIINDLIPGRAYGVVYQNLTLRPIFVIVTSQHTSGGGGQRARAIAYVQNATPPTNPCDYSGWLLSPGAATLHGVCSFFVPPGFYYQVLSDVLGGGANALNEWWEINL